MLQEVGVDETPASSKCMEVSCTRRSGLLFVFLIFVAKCAVIVSLEGHPCQGVRGVT